MSNVVKLSLAVVLALAAAALNAVWLTAEKRPPMYVGAGTDLGPGVVITEQMLTPVPVPGDPAHLNDTFIPFGARATLLGIKTSRTLIRGDMFLESDIKAPQQLAEYEVLGPFKLIGVGSRFTEAAAKKDESQLDASGNVITIAVNSKFDERTRRLLQIIEASRGGRGSAARIVAIQVIPKEEQKASPTDEDKNVVYQTISLDGITNVPRVLLEGDVIRFVIPAHSL